MKTPLILFFGMAATCLVVSDGSAALVRPKPPADGQAVALKKAAEILYRHADRGNKTPDLKANDPCQQYVVGLKDLAAGQLLSAARFSSWQYVLEDGTNVVGMVELRPDDTTGELRFAGFYDVGAPLDALREARQRAEQLPQIQKQDYEFRVLDIAPIYFHAVWLHAKTNDIIMPMPATFGRWKEYQPYSENEMLKLLRPEAKKVLKNNLIR